MLAMLLGGCSFAPSYEPPQAGLPASYGAAGGGSISETAAVIGWRTFFPDPRLQALIAQALDHNSDLQVAVHRVEEVRAQYRIERAASLPQIDATGSMIRGEMSGNTPFVGSDDIEGYQAGLAVSAYELDFWGRVANLKQAALQQYLASEEARRAFAISLVSQVADTYLQARELDERIDLAEQTLSTLEESLRIARRRYELGETSELEYRQAQSLTGVTRANLASLRESAARNRNRLRELVGQWPGDLPAPRELGDQGIVTELPAGLPSDLLVRRPDLQRDEALLRAANANIGAARAAFLPQITLTGSYGTSSDELSGLFDEGTGSWLFMPRLSLPIFDYGRRSAALDVATARRNQQVAQYEADIKQAFREVRDALDARAWLQLQIAALRDTVEAQQVRTHLAQVQYDNGLIAYLQVLDARRELFDQQQRLVQVRRAALSNAVALYSALGGGLNATDNQDGKS